jgi:hypothetical protein
MHSTIGTDTETDTEGGSPRAGSLLGKFDGLLSGVTSDDGSSGDDSPPQVKRSTAQKVKLEEYHEVARDQEPIDMLKVLFSRDLALLPSRSLLAMLASRLFTLRLSDPFSGGPLAFAHNKPPRGSTRSSRSWRP